MIFVTVGTHEQQFNRLIKKVDELKRKGLIKEKVFMQIGFSDYTPKYCEYKSLISYDEMIKYLNEARIIIVHGGPASFMKVLNVGKVPLVVPRKKIYGEHVNDHQLNFAREVKRIDDYPIYLIEDVEEIEAYVCMNSEKFLVTSKKSHQEQFCLKLKEIIDDVVS